MKIIKLSVVLYVIVILLGTDTYAQEKGEIILGVETSILPSPVWVAENKRYFQEEGLNVKIKEFGPGRSALKTMLTEGNLDMVTCAQTPVMFNSFTRNDYAIIAAMVYSDSDVKVLARQDKGITKASDLKDKKVGTTKGSTGHYFLGLFMVYGGISFPDVKVVDLEATQLTQALVDGLVDAISTWEPHIMNARRSLTLLEKNLWRVKNDPGQAEQAIMNLTVNARDAMPDGGKLTIETANVELDQAYARAHIAVTPGCYVMISVSDTGIGMTPEIRDRVFEPFFTTKAKEKGTGLGLSTVYGIVKQSGGNIWVYSEPGKGTTFKIYLPAVGEAPEELKKRLATKELPRGSKTILIAEDEEVVLKLAGRILRKQGYKVWEALGGEEAVKMCEKQKKPFQLLLTDVVMPQMSGRQLADRLKEICEDFKVLYMSGYTDNAITHHGILDKGVNYLQKPFTVESLVRKVKEVLDK